MDLSQRIYSTAELTSTGMTSRDIKSALTAKKLIKLRRGVYLRKSEKELTPREWTLVQHLAEVKALRNPAVFSRESAALFWEAPLMRLPNQVHLASAQKDRGKYPRIKLQPTAQGPLKRAQDFGDYKLLTPADTVVSCVLALPAHETLMIANDFLKRQLCSAGFLSQELSSVRGKGGAKAERIARCLTPLLDSPLESMAYLLLQDSKLEPANLQMWLRASSGRNYRPDFCWPHLKLILEVDGMVKYSGVYGTAESKGAYEYQRQRDLEADGWRFVRTTYDELLNRPLALVRRLQAEGVQVLH